MLGPTTKRQDISFVFGYTATQIRKNHPSTQICARVHVPFNNLHCFL